MTRTALILAALSIFVSLPAMAADYRADYNNDTARALVACAAMQQVYHDAFTKMKDIENANTTLNITTAYKKAAMYYAGAYDINRGIRKAGNDLINAEMDVGMTKFRGALGDKNKDVIDKQTEFCTSADATAKVKYGFEAGKKQGGSRW